MKKLRMYKGVTYNCGFWYDRAGDCFSTAASVIVNNRDSFSDADHAPLMDLKKTPYEPTPKLEDVLESAYMEWNASRNTGVTMFSNLFQFTARRIRNAFPHIDEENA